MHNEGLSTRIRRREGESGAMRERRAPGRRWCGGKEVRSRRERERESERKRREEERFDDEEPKEEWPRGDGIMGLLNSAVNKKYGDARAQVRAGGWKNTVRYYKYVLRWYGTTVVYLWRISYVFPV